MVMPRAETFHDQTLFSHRGSRSALSFDCRTWPTLSFVALPIDASRARAVRKGTRMTAGVTRTAIWLRIFCAVLLLSLGFSHKPLYAQPSTDPAGSYYVLPDGTFAGLCIGNADRGKPEKSWFGGGCDVCRLASSVLLPTLAADHAALLRGDRGIDFPVRAAFPGRAIERPGSPVRGPPSSFA